MNKRAILLFLILLSFIPSCYTVDAYVQAQVEGVPVWVYEQDVAESQEAFVVKYIPTTRDETKNSANLILDVLIEEIENKLGYSLSGEEKKELRTTKELESIGLVVSQEFVKTNKDDTIELFLLAIADKALIAERASEKKEINIEATQREKDLLLQASTLYRANKDLESAKIYLKLAKLTNNNYYYDRVKKILNRVKITIKAKTASTFDVYISRTSHWVGSPIIAAKLKFISPAYDALGNQYEESVAISSDKDGYINYSFINQLELKEGVLKVGLDFTLDTVIDLNVKSELEEILKEKTVIMPYEMAATTVGYEVQEYSKLGNPLDTEYSFLGFRDMAELLTTKSYNTLEKSTKYNYKIVGKVAITETVLIQGDYITSVKGSGIIYNKEGKLLFDTEYFESMGIGSTEEESVEKAFQRFGSMLFVVAKPYLI